MKKILIRIPLLLLAVILFGSVAMSLFWHLPEWQRREISACCSTGRC
jgi:hypothetical protein